MPQLIDIPGQGTVEFPDSMSDEQIVRAIKKDSLLREQDSARADNARTDPMLSVAEGVEQFFQGASLEGIAQNIGRPLLESMNTAGKVAQGGAVDLMAGNLLPGPGRIQPNLRNTEAALRSEPMPDESQLTTVQKGVADAAHGAPLIAVGMALAAAGVPAPLAFGGLMGAEAYHATGDATQAAQAATIGAVIPAVGERARVLAGRVLARAVRAGAVPASSPVLHKAVESVVSQSAVQAVIETSRLPEYAGMTPAERKQALIRSVSGNLAFGLMELPAFRRGIPSETQKALAEDVARWFDEQAARPAPKADPEVPTPVPVDPDAPAADPAVSLDVELSTKDRPLRDPARGGNEESGPGVPAAETITGSNERKGSEMPAEPVVAVTPSDENPGTVGAAGRQSDPTPTLPKQEVNDAVRRAENALRIIQAFPPAEGSAAAIVEQWKAKRAAQEQTIERLRAESAESKLTVEIPALGQDEVIEAPPQAPVVLDETGVVEPIKLGLNRDSVIDSQLSTLDEDAFFEYKKSVDDRLDELEKDYDDRGDEFSQEDQQILAEAQDKFSATENEAFRRRVAQMPPPDLMRELRQVAGKAMSRGKGSDEMARASIIMDEMERQGATQEDLLSEINFKSHDDAEIFKYDLEAIREISKTRPKAKAKALVEAPLLDVRDPSENVTNVMEANGPAKPETAAKKARKRRAQAEAERAPDLIDFVGQIGKIWGKGRARPGTEGYYGDAYNEAVRHGLVRGLVSNKRGQSPDEIADSLRRAGHVSEDFTVDDLWDSLIGAAEARVLRREGKTAEQITLKREQKQTEDFEKIALRNKRPKDAPEKGEPIAVGELFEGDEFTLAGEKVRVNELKFDEDGELQWVMLEDGARFGVQRVGGNSVIYADQKSYEPAEVSTDFLADDPFAEPDLPPENPTVAPKLRDGERQGDLMANISEDFALVGEKGVDHAAAAAAAQEAKAAAEAARLESDAKQSRIPGVEASGRPGITGHELGESGAPPFTPKPRAEDSPTFTSLPVNLPEAVRFARDLMGGIYPAVRQRIRALGGKAAGVFIHTDGPGGRSRIELLADIADLVSPSEKARLREEANDYAERMAEDGDNVRAMAEERYQFLLERAYADAKKLPPVEALKVLWHEIGHLVDWLPDKMISGRGNIFGRIAGLKNYLKHTIALDPSKPMGAKLSAAERRQLREDAENQLRQEFGPIREVVETIMVEEPEYQVLGITPADIKELFGMNAREDMPELYRWFAEQDSGTKKQIILKAMKGLVDERLEQFGKKVQTGTRRIQKTKTTRVGKEPTQDQIKARLKVLIREAMLDRNQAQIEVVRAELSGAIAWWHGTDTIPDYFKGSTEMFADAFSIFMNNPVALQKRAPTFAAMLFRYLERKPQIKRMYDKIQNEIKAGQVEDIAEREMLDSWDKAERESLDKADSRSRSEKFRDFLDNVSYHFDRRFGPIYRAAKGGIREGRLRQAVGNFIYRASSHERLLNHLNHRVSKPLVAAGLDWKDLGRFMFYKRVTDERFKIFNPHGIAPDRATNRLDNMRRKFGRDKFGVLEQAHKDFQALYQDQVVRLMKSARMWTPELQAQIEANLVYATFDVRQDAAGKDGLSRLLDNALGANVGPHIYRQVGTLKEIRNPATATVLKALSLVSAAHRNIAKRETVLALLETDAKNIVPAETRWTGKRREPVIKDSNGVGTVVYLEDGKPKAYYVKSVVADALNKGNHIENQIALSLVRATAGLKSAYTQLNYAFWPVAFIRDAIGLQMQLKGMNPVQYARIIRPAVAAARASIKGTPNKVADSGLARNMLISRADPHGVWTAAGDEFELKIASYGLNPAAWNKEAGHVSRIVKAWNAYREAGVIFERTHKLAGMIHIDEKFPNMPEWQKREIVRERAGSPDFLQRGAANPFVDWFMMFYNPWKESARSVGKAIRDNPFSFAAKSTAFVIAPTVLQALGAAGLFGEDIEEQYRSIPDYDLTNHLIIPMGWANKEQQVATYLRLPLWEPARILHGTLWQGVTGRGQGIGSFLGGTVPSMNALLSTVSDWVQFEVFGHNPYDAFRGQPLLDEDTFKAGGWAARKEMLKRSWNNLGGSLVFRAQDKRLESPPETDTQKFLALPIISNALGRWVKISNRGRSDEARRLSEPSERHRATIRKGMREVVRKLEAGEALVDSEKLMLREPYALSHLMNLLPRLNRARAHPLIRSLDSAPNPDAKRAILENEIKRKSR